jgi:hypothetical protein
VKQGTQGGRDENECIVVVQDQEVSIGRKNRGDGSITNVSICTNKEATEGSAHRIGMHRGKSQHTPSIRCLMREETPKKKI